MTPRRRAAAVALALPLLGVMACERDAARSPAPAPRAAVVRDASLHTGPAAPVDAGNPEHIVARVRVKNVDSVPLRILTNPDANELIHVFRVRVSPDTSDRAALFAQGDRVKAFPIGRMPMCSADGGAGYGGLGQAGDVTLAPGESFEAARWDGMLREEVLDPVRGVCARETVAAPGRYRFHLDQPQLEGAPVCQRALLAYPVVADGGAPGVPVLELRCRNAPRDAGTRGGPVNPPAVPP